MTSEALIADDTSVCRVSDAVNRRAAICPCAAHVVGDTVALVESDARLSSGEAHDRQLAVVTTLDERRAGVLC